MKSQKHRRVERVASIIHRLPSQNLHVAAIAAQDIDAYYLDQMASTLHGEKRAEYESATPLSYKPRHRKGDE